MATSIPLVAADFETSLDASVAQGATTATLLSQADEDGVNLTDGLYAFTIDNDTDYKEYIVCTKVGTALTSISNISRQGVVTSGFANYHRRGASVQITDWAILYRLMANLTGAINLNSAVPLQYDDTATISSANMLATKAYVDSIVSGGTITFDQQIISNQTAGENLTAGNLVYFKTSDQRWYNTDADTSSTVVGVRLGIAVSTATTGNMLQIVISGPYTTSGLTAGAKYYASSTAGAITATAPSAPAFPVFVGWALSTTKLLFNPLSTTDQFAGIAATPSATNKFLAQADSSADATDQSQTTQNGTFSAGEADATTRHNKLAQSFIPTKTILRGVNLYKSTNTGTFTGTVTIALQADSAGSPSGVNLASKTITNALWRGYSNGDFLALFSSEITVTPGNLYWIVISTSTADTANCINLGTNTAGGYANGSAKYNNTADGWVAIATLDLYFKVLEGANGKTIAADSSGIIPVGVRKITLKTGTAVVTTTGVSVVHGLGKVPNIVHGYYAEAETGQIAYSTGVYDVANNAYLSNSANYADGSSSGGGLGTGGLVLAGLSNNITITVSAIDENVVIFTASSSSPTIGYEIIG